MSNIEKIINAEDIAERIQELAKRINKDYENEELVVVGVLNGSFVFCADLVRELDLTLSCEFVRASSYGDTKVSSGNVKLLLDLSKEKIEGKNILLVEDIVDTGNTISFLKEHFSKFSPKTLKVCSFLLKEEEFKYDFDIEYVGFSIPSLFVIGYGLDYAGLYRELPYLGVFLEDDEKIDLDNLEFKKP